MLTVSLSFLPNFVRDLYLEHHESTHAQDWQLAQHSPQPADTDQLTTVANVLFLFSAEH